VARAARREAARAGKIAPRKIRVIRSLSASPFCGAVARAGPSQERENSSTSVERTGHLSVQLSVID
jgi:hypothetical protein